MVHYEDRLPLIWVAKLPDEESGRHHLETTNLYVLDGVAAVEEMSAERFKEEQPELHQELSRLDAKLHLVLDMVARLLHREQQLPEARPVRVSAHCLEFPAEDDETEPDQRGTLRLHLHPAIPAPLALPGTIVEVRERDDQRWVRFEPDKLSQTLKDALSRHVFRHHRRMVAAARRDSSNRQGQERE